MKMYVMLLPDLILSQHIWCIVMTTLVTSLLSVDRLINYNSIIGLVVGFLCVCVILSPSCAVVDHKCSA